MIARERQYLIGVVALYAWAFGLMLLNAGAYWDDWTILGHDHADLVSVFSQLGLSAWGTIHYVLSSSPWPVATYRVSTFLIYLAVAMCLNGILRTRSGIATWERYAIVGIFTVFPINSARITLICFPYAVSLLAFYVGFLAVARATTVASPWRHLLAAVPCLWFACSTGSIRVFMGVIFAFLAIDICQRWTSVSEAMVRYRPYLVLVPLPVVFHYYFITVHRPNGIYEGYNAVSLEGLRKAPTLLDETFFRSVLLPLLNVDLAVSVQPYVNLSVLSGVSVLLLAVKRLGQRRLGVLLGLGLIAWVLGAFPYNALGRLPEQNDWWSRDQILLPLGTALMLFAVFRAVLMDRIVPTWFVKTAAICGVLYLSVLSQASLLRYQADWFKQESLRVAFAASPLVRESTVLLFDDDTRGLNVNRRTYRFYEYTGLLKSVFGDERRYAADYAAGELEQIKAGTFFSPRHNADYNMGDFRAVTAVTRMRITFGPFGQQLSDKIYMETLWLLRDKYLAPAAYRQKIQALVGLTVVRPDS